VRVFNEGVAVATAGQKLRALRDKLGFTLRDVEESSTRLAERLGNTEYAIPLSRLSDIETKNNVPNIFRMYVLAVLYRLDFHELMSWYGVDLSRIPLELQTYEPRHTHPIEPPANTHADIPVRLDPSFDLRHTSNLGRMIEKWGMVPLSYLRPLTDNKKYTYGYIGSEDYTMYPLLLPGCFVQVDETRHEVEQGVWRSERERPIYFVEMRGGHVCCWCSVNEKTHEIYLQPHPLSPVPPRTMHYPHEAEVIGQVVGIAMRLDQFSAPVPRLDSKVPAKLN